MGAECSLPYSFKLSLSCKCVASLSERTYSCAVKAVNPSNLAFSRLARSSVSRTILMRLLRNVSLQLFVRWLPYHATALRIARSLRSFDDSFGSRSIYVSLEDGMKF